MSSTRTLADRFRTQRTDRIRVDDSEILSLAEVILRPTSSLELIVEQQRRDTQQILTIRSRTKNARLVSVDSERLDSEPCEAIDIYVPDARSVEVTGSDDEDTILQLWNSWRIGDTNHSWLGNSGVIIEDLAPPAEANLRFRLWFSDGLGEPTFDDLVVLATVGERLPQ